MKKFVCGKNVKISKKSVVIEPNVVIKDNVKIFDNVRILGDTIIEEGVVVMSFCEISDCVIGKGSIIKNSVLEGSFIGEDNKIGPFSRIRPGTKTERNVKIGNFVEVKNSILKEGVKASHLAYIGDAEVGKNVNVGCGAIFVNYNGKIKQKSIVGDNSFIGSNCNIIAPVKIGKGVYITAGTTVTEDIPDDDFVIGRVRQEHKSGVAKRYIRKEE